MQFGPCKTKRLPLISFISPCLPWSTLILPVSACQGRCHCAKPLLQLLSLLETRSSVRFSSAFRSMFVPFLFAFRAIFVPSMSFCFAVWYHPLLLHACTQQTFLQPGTKFCKRLVQRVCAACACDACVWVSACGHALRLLRE